ncbi:metallophosphoesterase [Deinococcus sonorensis]|uniref:Metallophosphoesterase n=2 Tax=Deinococcus sonorensis TaxID=309891 RepID=A0AAU7U8B4_9DEIO
MADLWVVGDVHGALVPLRTLLRRARLVDEQDRWTGGDARLVFLGDLTDRGPDGFAVLRLVQALERQAAQVGGEVYSLLGNHEVMLLAALHFGGRRAAGNDPYGLYDYWRQNGGRRRDLARIEPTDVTWLQARPAMLQLDHWLFVHADAPLYQRLGQSLEAVNQRMAALLHAQTPDIWGELLNAFAERSTFAGPDGRERARQQLERYGGRRIAHGHTPVFVLRADEPGASQHPHSYAGGLVLGLDSGMAYLRGSGFMVRLNERPGLLGSGILETVYLQG